MRRILGLVLAVLVLTAGAAACGGSDGPDDADRANNANQADESGGSAASGSHADDAADHATASVPSSLADPVAQARLATAPYAFDRQQAETDGYTAITPMMPDMGYHLMNADITDFDPEKPPILVYLPTDDDGWQLGALEWVFPEEPAEPPFPGAEYGEFGAACHYGDGTFVFAASEAACGTTSPDTGAAFSFWHPELVTMHLWVWYPNPDGLFAGTNPLVGPYNEAVQSAETCGRMNPC